MNDFVEIPNQGLINLNRIEKVTEILFYQGHSGGQYRITLYTGDCLHVCDTDYPREKLVKLLKHPLHTISNALFEPKDKALDIKPQHIPELDGFKKFSLKQTKGCFLHIRNAINLAT